MCATSLKHEIILSGGHVQSYNGARHEPRHSVLPQSWLGSRSRAFAHGCTRTLTIRHDDMPEPLATDDESKEHSYAQLWAFMGVPTAYLCLNSFLVERQMQELDLPLNIFKHLKGMLVAVPAMIVCWPLAAILYYLGRRLIELRGNQIRWKRLPLAFGGLKPASRFDGRCYWLFFLLAFHLLPFIHLLHFGVRFFILYPPQPLFELSRRAFFDGNWCRYPATLSDNERGLSFYPAWETPFLLLLGTWVMWQAVRFFFALLHAQTPRQKT
jgi:hypothetical protein